MKSPGTVLFSKGTACPASRRYQNVRQAARGLGPFHFLRQAPWALLTVWGWFIRPLLWWFWVWFSIVFTLIKLAQYQSIKYGVDIWEPRGPQNFQRFTTRSGFLDVSVFFPVLGEIPPARFRHWSAISSVAWPRSSAVGWFWILGTQWALCIIMSYIYIICPYI